MCINMFAVFLICVLSASVQDVWVGNDAIDREWTDSGSGMQFVSEYTIPVSGILSLWQIYSSRSDIVVLQVWRQVGHSLEYSLVGSTTHYASIGFNEIEANIKVQTGDVLGWFCSGKQPIKHDLGEYVVRRVYGYTGAESTVDMSEHSTGWGRHYSIKAYVTADLVFVQVAAPGKCLSNHVNDIGLVIGNAPHTIQVRLTFPQSTSHKRQWILNLGQSDVGSQHWIWHPSNKVVQIGAWGGAQINGVDITQCTDLSTTYSGSVLKLYCNGVFMSEKQVGLDITHSNLAIGDIGSHFVHENAFAGCISEVKVWSFEKSAEKIAQQTRPAFWESCRWETVQDPNLANNFHTKDYLGYSCAHNEVLTGFGLSAKKNDVTKVQCCELGGHSSVISNSCSFIDASHPVASQTQGFQPDVAICDANAHMVFSGVYDKEIAPGDEITELLAGKCCEVECHAPWCAGQDWGVNSEKCKILSVHPGDKGEKKLVCPHGTLMTEIKDGFAGRAHGLQHISSIVCCELDLVAPPTKAPSVMPTTSPSTSPTAPPTKAPSTMPTTSPSTAPTTAPSPMPTPAPTSTTECLRELQQAKLTLGEFLEGIRRCLPWCEVDQYRRAHWAH